jgi:regulatory protein
MSPTILEIQPKPRGVAAIVLDAATEEGESTRPLLLPFETVVLHHLREGAHIEPAAWSRIRGEGQLTLPTRRGLELLARRQRTERELRQALGRTFDDEAIEGAVSRLRELGYLNDPTVARSHVASPRAAQRGRALLRLELRRRGIDDPVVAEALEDHDDLEAAYAVAAKRSRALRRLDADRRQRRLYDFLRRRGFGDPLARRAIASALAEEDATAE